MAEYVTTDTELTSVANAIRTKGGTSASLAYPTGFVSAIEAIPTGSTLPSATGVYFGNVIVISSFIFNDSEAYQFEEGMTWGDWLTSSYNTSGAFSTNGDYVTWWGMDVTYNSTNVVVTDVVTNGNYYV